ncbi:MAG: energy transducer TonB [Sphingomonas sp.]|uniref:energy transducer TonB n=1 Tax=Sphingomonas sp. TaxID=28214 RepID=UPI003F7D2ABD
MQPIYRLAICAAIASAPLPAAAREWPKTAGWDIIEFKNDCAIHSTFTGKGETDLTLFLELDGQAILLVGDGGRSGKADLTYALDGKRYAGGPSVESGGEFEARKALAPRLGTDFLTDFAAASTLAVLKRDVVVGRMSLRGSAAAIAVAKRCVAQVLDALPAPTYAGVVARPIPIHGGPKGNPGYWFTNDDYPADAKRAGAQGTVSIVLSVDASGIVTGCRVATSSGNASLDAATCTLATRRGRFNVQKDAEGKAQPYTYTMPGIHWSLNGQ